MNQIPKRGRAVMRPLAIALNMSIMALAASPALAQDAPVGASQYSAQNGAQDAKEPKDRAAKDATLLSTIVVTGIRASLTSAVENKRYADQVVDSIVADDIGKLPDRTVAAALQRVPGVQVSVSDNGEIVQPLIRGLSDTLTTLEGREIFTGVSRQFSVQYIPAAAIKQVDVYKSNSANLLQGGVAGVINMRLRKPFDFPGFAIGGNVTGSYSKNAGKLNPNVNMFVNNIWDTDIGKVGLFVIGSYSRNDFQQGLIYSQANSSGYAFPSNAPVGSRAEGGMLSPSYGGNIHYGHYSRPFLTATAQWAPTSSLEVYLTGMYAGSHSKSGTDYVIANANEASSIDHVVIDKNSCNDYLVGADGHFSPTGTKTHLCNVQSYSAHDFHALVGNHGDKLDGAFRLFATGVKYSKDRLHLNVDLSYEQSRYTRWGAFFDTGKMVDTINVRSNVGGVPRWSLAGNPLGDPSGFAITDGLNISHSNDFGKQFDLTMDGVYDLRGWLENIQFGIRASNRTANYQQSQINAGPPGGPYATPVTALGGSDIFTRVPGIRWINGGQSFSAVSSDLLLDHAFQNKLQALFGVPTGTAPFDPTRSFYAREKDYAGYLQTKYYVSLGESAYVDGLIGVRAVNISRRIRGTGTITKPDPDNAGGSITILNPVSRKTHDTNYLPNLSARIVFGGGFQVRLSYDEVIAQPQFSSLNPGLTYAISSNPAVPSSGHAGNPDLKAQKADEYDVGFGYYFGKGSYIAFDGFYKKLTNRVASKQFPEVIDGITYMISRPHNIAGADIKGIEVGGLIFMDFLPGALSGFGVLANYTYLDSEITSKDDPLYGYALQGVAKNNYNVGLVYDKDALSARLIYTYKGSHYDGDNTAGWDLRPVSLGTAFLYAKASTGRLDFSVNYDVNSNITLSFGATNLTGEHSTRYRYYPVNPASASDWDRTMYASLRMKF